MSKIKKSGLDQYGKVQSLNAIGGERVKGHYYMHRPHSFYFQYLNTTSKNRALANWRCIYSMLAIVTLVLPHTHAFPPRHWCGDPATRPDTH